MVVLLQQAFSHILTLDDDNSMIVGRYIEGMFFGEDDTLFHYSGVEYGLLGIADSRAGWSFSMLVTLPVIGLRLWKLRTNGRNWRSVGVAALTACGSLFALWVLADTKATRETVELFQMQFALFNGYIFVLTISWLTGWTLLAINQYFRDVSLTTAGASALLISIIFQSVAGVVRYITPLHKIWWY